LDVVDKSGAWFSYKDKKLGQGRENAKALLKENKELAEEIEENIRNAMGLDPSIMVAGDDELIGDDA
jgi:recombination protein RecA